MGMDISSLAENNTALQMDYMQDVYQRYYREPIFRFVKERLREIPKYKVLKLSLVLILSVQYFSTREEGGDTYGANSGYRAEVIRLRNTDADIYQKIDELWERLRSNLEHQLNEFIPGVHNSGWIIKSHRYIEIDMDFVTDSFTRSYIKEDKWVRQNVINVKNEDDDYCLLYCYLKHKERLENPQKRIYGDTLNKKKCEKLLEENPELKELVTSLPAHDKQEFAIKMRQIEAILKQNINVLYYQVCTDEAFLNSKDGKHDWFIGEGMFDGGYYTSFFDNRDNIYQENKKEILNLLLKVNEQGHSHFAYIKNLNVFFVMHLLTIILVSKCVTEPYIMTRQERIRRNGMTIMTVTKMD